ncbi:MAG: restriction endonuclease subunit S, partial [Bacteroidales bacterium]|nr:restriction endonuclease subunit S [Bacteroidales bacterium]
YNSFLSIFKQLLNQAAVPIRPYFYKDILVEYLFYYLSEMSEINSISTKGSAGQVNISLTQSPNMRIALPPLNEQKRIVAKIEELFAVLDEIQKSIEA